MIAKQLCRANPGGGISLSLLTLLGAASLVLVSVMTPIACDRKPAEQTAAVPVNVADISTAPIVSAADRAHADVFKPLDGVWEGEFKIFTAPENEPPQGPGLAQPRDITGVKIAAPPLRLLQTIRVRQQYVSESPYFQRATIHDTYNDERGERTVKSEGVNKVQEGLLWCVVKKPDETVVHAGSAPGPGIILWQRDLRRPLKIEYFHETVRANSYTIRGWGYYGEDDPEKAPRLWFLGEYKRVP